MNDNTNIKDCEIVVGTDLNQFKSEIIEILNTFDVVKFLLKDPNDLSSDYALILGLKTIVDNLYAKNILITAHEIKQDV